MNCPKCNQELIEVNGKYLCVDCGIEVPASGSLPDIAEKTGEETAETAPAVEDSIPTAGSIEVKEILPTDGASDSDVEAAVTAAFNQPLENPPAIEPEPLPEESTTVTESSLKAAENSLNEENVTSPAPEVTPPSADILTEEKAEIEGQDQVEKVDLGLYQDPMYDMTEKETDSETPQPLPEKESGKMPAEIKLVPEIKAPEDEQKNDTKKEETRKLKAMLIVGIALIVLLTGSGLTAYFFLTGGK